MKTIMISGNDTGIGKTWICRALAGYLVAQNQSVQVVKVIETGVTDGQKGDAATAAEGYQCEAYTLYSYAAPLAPVSAARKVGCTLNIADIANKIKNLPQTDWRILETAGGLAVPLDDAGSDTVDLALNLPADYLLLVVQNRLGAIHQARVLTAYAPHTKITTGIWFNDCMPVDKEVTDANYAELTNLPVAIWGHQLHQSSELRFYDSCPITRII